MHLTPSQPVFLIFILILLSFLHINILEESFSKRNLKGSDDGVQHSESLGFWTLSIVQVSKYQKTQRFGNWICFHPQVKGETPTQMGPLERANPIRSTPSPPAVDGNRSSFRNVVFYSIRNPADGQSSETQ
jgi:hypothetical protein